MTASFTPPRLELWAGTECTLNRVGDRYFDQLERSGHAQRITDLDLFANLGVRTMRYPILWERTAPQGLAHADWDWADARLGRLRELGIRPIVGLVHHGSGPRDTNLLDPQFADRLAEYAAAVAARYPWVDAYTPVNEPLTTARFSGLYGVWYPHHRDDASFVRALLNQCRATNQAMAAIRQYNPRAQLVQTEDLGRTYSTPLLAYQAEFENQRRWLSFDLLCGLVDCAHPLWSYLRDAGVKAEELDWFRAHPCPPDIIGLNHYITSERFLDEGLERYPAHTHGGNGRHAYADVEAVRVGIAGGDGLRVGLAEAWARYRRPLAITEAHLGSSREQQLRWLAEVWHQAEAARAAGVDVRAVTVWSLLGAYDWDSLVTRDESHYEEGAFDLRAPHPRPTALSGLARQLANGGPPQHPALAALGWWRQPSRVIYQPTSAPTRLAEDAPCLSAARPILISGANGTLGRAFARLCAARNLAYCLLDRQQLDIADPAAVQAALKRYQPWAVVNAAGYVRVDEAEREAATCLRHNRDGPAILAAACAAQGVQLLTFSSDLVFDGRKGEPYVESDLPYPLNVYGQSKAEAERLVQQAMPAALIVRTSAFFGPCDDYNFVTVTLRRLRAGELVRAETDSCVSPTYVPDLVHHGLDLLIDGEQGIWHLTNVGAVSWAELARQTAMAAGFDPDMVQVVHSHKLGYRATRPRYSVLGSARGWLMPPFDDALRRYFADVAA